MTPLVKVGIVAGTFTTLASAGYIGGICSAPNLKISKLIGEEYTYLLLNQEEEDYWTTNWNKYKEQKGNVFGLAGWKDNNDSLDLKKELKKTCASLKDYFVYSKEDELYKNVTNYCARYVTVADEAIKNGFKILDTKGETSSTEWSNKDTYKSAFLDDLNTLGITDKPLDARKIKAGCEKAKTKDKKLLNYKDVYNSYKTLCTNGVQRPSK